MACRYLVALITALDRRGLIGTATGLPWRLPCDLKRFKQLTLGKPVLMGRKTFELIGRPLPGRHNIILTRDGSFAAAGCDTAHTLAEALALAEKSLATSGKDEAFVIGGREVYIEASRLWDRLYLTVVDGSFEGTTYFPLEALEGTYGRVVGEESWPPDAKNRHGHSFYVIERDWDAEKMPKGEQLPSQGVVMMTSLIGELFSRRDASAQA